MLLCGISFRFIVRSQILRASTAKRKKLAAQQEKRPSAQEQEKWNK